MRVIVKLLRALGSHTKTTILAGMVVSVPVVVTVVILRFLYDFFNPLLSDLLEKFAPEYVFPGMGIAALVIIVYLAGLLTNQVLGRRMINLMYSTVELIPVVSSVYRTARQATQVFSTVGGDGKGNRYSGVVMIDFPGAGLRSLGLVTGRTKDQDGNMMLAVYVPTSPFPTSGFLIIMREDQVTPTDMSVDDAMKAIVSAGLAIPDSIVSFPNPLRDSPKAQDTPLGAEGLPDLDQTPDSDASNQ